MTMNKRALLFIFIIVIALIASFFVFKDAFKAGFSAGNLTLTAGNPKCAFFNLTIEKVECEDGTKGVNISVSRGWDELGIGELSINVMDENNETLSIGKMNFKNDESADFTLYSITVSEETKLTTELKIVKENKTTICYGPEEIHSCRKILPGNETQPVEETEKLVPEPFGAITLMDRSDDSSNYFCNNTVNPEHGIRIYSYRNINSTRVLSENYIESSKARNVCDSYPDGKNGRYYSLEWKWQSVGGIDGYKIYQYYSQGNILRDYDSFVILGAGATMLLDDGLDLWKFQELKELPEDNESSG